MFVIFEGPDGVGKTTLAKNVENILRKKKYVSGLESIRFPYYDHIRNIVLSSDNDISPYSRQLFMFSDFICKMSEEYTNINDSKIYLFDRFTPISALVYHDNYSEIVPLVREVIPLIEGFDPLIVVYHIDNPPFREAGGDYFEDNNNYNSLNEKYNTVISSIFPSLLGDLKYKYLCSKVNVREASPKIVAQDILKFYRRLLLDKR